MIPHRHIPGQRLNEIIEYVDRLESDTLNLPFDDSDPKPPTAQELKGIVHDYEAMRTMLCTPVGRILDLLRPERNPMLKQLIESVVTAHLKNWDPTEDSK